MNLFRVVFLVLSLGAIGGAAYVSYQGIGGQSTDLDASVRTGSGGNGVIGVVGRIK